MNTRSHGSLWFAWSSALLGASTVIYLAAYLWMVQPCVVVSSPDRVMSLSRRPTEARYLWGTGRQQAPCPRLWSALFTPIHELDRRVRRHVWRNRVPPLANNPHHSVP
jgi:hypothetical protein